MSEQIPISIKEDITPEGCNSPSLGYAAYEELAAFSSEHGHDTDPDHASEGQKVWNNFYIFGSYKDENGLFWRNNYSYDQYRPVLKPHFRDDEAIKSYDIYLPHLSTQMEILKYTGLEYGSVEVLEDVLRQDPGYGLNVRPVAPDLYQLNVDVLAELVVKGADAARLQKFGRKMWGLVDAFVDHKQGLLEVQQSSPQMTLREGESL